MKLLLLGVITLSLPLYAANTDTIKTQNQLIKSKSLLIPAALISYGAVETVVGGKKLLNYSISHEIKVHIDNSISIDDFSQYAPIASVYALNLMGLKGRHKPLEQTFIISIASGITALTVNSLKYATKVLRPDGTSYNSFPSGHTAVAFMGAEFLWQEYKHHSIWYGIGGYCVATATGLFRIYNDRHWFGDVIAGAGIGMLSTKLAYWLYPQIVRRRSDTVCLPYYNGRQMGISISWKL
ncbi:phosphatase PAP2 family protein [Carboxylicivirga sediminis]|uniref:Phosphatase PAP2 family protein n=1 Tax=Carboxylicivirga sediminis TaxID=2006564 RepID=A0A941F5C7_9BACT|nr:phosphatase PAP2 family protein [Carboxylicivirga sediminis]MBR8536672.1 phosphatase PAP2 family protein [Carboxylicivirga sediminis]